MDRAAMMTWFLRYFHGELDQNDSAHTGPKPYTEDWDTDDVQGNWDFSDTGRELPGGQPFKLTIDGAGLSLSNQQIIFGNSKNETLEGEGQNDRLSVSRERNERLTALGWRLQLQRKAQAGKPLSDCQQRRKRRLASPRGRVEHVFAGLAVDFKQESRSVTSRQKCGG